MYNQSSYPDFLDKAAKYHTVISNNAYAARLEVMSSRFTKDVMVSSNNQQYVDQPDTIRQVKGLPNNMIYYNDYPGKPMVSNDQHLKR